MEPMSIMKSKGCGGVWRQDMSRSSTVGRDRGRRKEETIGRVGMKIG